MSNQLIISDEHLAEKKLKKANHEIGLIIEEGSMNFITRKLYNALIYHTQRLRQKGILPDNLSWGKIEVPTDLDVTQFFWIPLDALISDASTGNTYSTIRQWLLDMMRIVVKRSERESFSVLLPEVHLLNMIRSETSKKTEKKLAGRWMVGWNFTPTLERLILDPEQYTPISLQYQGRMSTEPALVLYEMGRRYAGWAEHRTKQMHWTEWQTIMVTGRTPRREYKFFKRDFINPAIDQINKYTDINIELIEIQAPGSARAISAIRFDVMLKSQTALDFSESVVIDVSLIPKMMETGMLLKTAQGLLEEFGEERCASNLALFHQSHGAESVGWLVSAIRSDYVNIEKTKKEMDKAEKKRLKKIGEENSKLNVIKSAELVQLQTDEELEKQNETQKLRTQTKLWYDSLTEDEKLLLLDEYCEGLAPLLAKNARLMLRNHRWIVGTRDAKMYLAWLALKNSVVL